MGLGNEDRDTLVMLYIRKSDINLKACDDAIVCGNFSNAVGRMYYSAFNLVCVLFVKDGIQINSHRGAKAVLGKNYVLPGKISTDVSRIFNQLESLRDRSEYNAYYEATEEDVAEFRPKLSEFLKVVRDLIEA